jgi:hypothetical protein
VGEMGFSFSWKRAAVTALKRRVSRATGVPPTRFDWLRRLFGLRQTAPPQKGAVQIGPGRDLWFDIVGESNYQGTLRRIDGREQGVVGACEARLTGAWRSAVHIGVRLSILPPEAFGSSGIQPVSETRDTRSRGLVCDSPGWESRPRVALPSSNGKSLALTQEHLCQDELLRLCDGRDPARVTCVFYAVLVPTEAGPIVCAEGGAPVGRLSKTDAERYRLVMSELTTAGAVGSTDGWIIPKRDGLGVRLSVATPAALLAHCKGARSQGENAMASDRALLRVCTR